MLARQLAVQISRSQGLSMVIENRPGAVTIIGTEAVSHAVPDGNTLLLISPTFVLNPHLRKLNYDPFTSFEPICYLVRTPTVILVNSASPYRTLAHLMDAARVKPGDLTLAAAGPATPAQMAFEMLKRTANVSMTFVPYPGGPPAVNALLGGHVTAALSDYPGAAEQLKAGKLRALATVSRTRVEVLPDVPTVAEFGYRDTEADLWFGVATPAKTPKETVSRIGVGSRQHSRYLTSGRTLRARGSTRSVCAARNSAPFFANNMTNLAASFVTLISRQSEPIAIVQSEHRLCCGARY
jgi:tripartite-type tricarboxylate transporter receptor subunit TctC